MLGDTHKTSYAVGMAKKVRGLTKGQESAEKQNQGNDGSEVSSPASDIKKCRCVRDNNSRDARKKTDRILKSDIGERRPNIDAMEITVNIPDEELQVVRARLHRKLVAIELGLDIVQPEEKLAVRVLMAAGVMENPISEKGDRT